MVIDVNIYELNCLLKAMEHVRNRNEKATTKFRSKFGDDFVERPDIKKSIELLIAKLEKAHMDHMLKLYEGYSV
jgi:Holliday junction resolvasome RuvABC ATP-dependent DNA helicase subunit